MSLNVIKGSGKKVICLQTVTNTRTHSKYIRTTEIINKYRKTEEILPQTNKQMKDVGLSKSSENNFQKFLRKVKRKVA